MFLLLNMVVHDLVRLLVLSFKLLCATTCTFQSSFFKIVLSNPETFYVKKSILTRLSSLNSFTTWCVIWCAIAPATGHVQSNCLPVSVLVYFYVHRHFCLCVCLLLPCVYCMFVFCALSPHVFFFVLFFLLFF